MSEVYIPTKYIETNVRHPVIFLGGPIQGADDWQSKATEIIAKENSYIIVASPRGQYLPGEFDYDGQADWETFHLKRAAKNGVIMFWFPKPLEHFPDRAYAQKSRVGLRQWATRHELGGSDMVIGIEEGFSGEKYIRKRLNRDRKKAGLEPIPIFSTLEETCRAAVYILDRSIINNPLPKRKKSRTSED